MINWNREKNEWLKEIRNIFFEDILYYIANDMQIDDIEHPDQEKYEGQRISVINVNEYVYLVPYVETENEIFLKTIIPSRKATKKYLENKNE